MILLSPWFRRAFLFCWSFSSMVLATLYMGALNSINTSDPGGAKFRSQADLAYSPLPLFAGLDYVKGYR